MAARITLAVPDDLSEKIKEWKPELNLSKIFQDAVSRVIEEKEAFRARLESEVSIPDLVARLSSERAEMASNFFEEGKRQGMRRAKAAPYGQYLELQELGALNKDFTGRTGALDRAIDTIFEEVFGEIADQGGELYAAMRGDMVDTNESFRDPESFVFQNHRMDWFRGWIVGINEVWKEVEPLLEG